MGKKTTTNPKATAPAKRAAKPTAKTKTATAAIVTPPPRAVAPKAAIPKATPAKRTAKPATPAAPAYTPDDVALRAYFIAEKRQAAGIHGDSHQDWVEAERQLVAEAAAAKKPKAKARKA